MSRSAMRQRRMTLEEVEMRGTSLVLAAAALVSCTSAIYPPPGPSARAQFQYRQLLAGRVPEAPMTCLPTRRANDMVVIDDNTIAFRDGARVYVSHPEGGCPQISQGHTALVSRQYAQEGPCRGDVVQVVDTFSHVTVGSCTWGDFIPYVRQGA